jgi:hypothetical protein
VKEKKGNQFRAPQNNSEALVRALKLGITASNQARANLALALAIDIASHMSEFEVAKCKKQVLKELGVH